MWAPYTIRPVLVKDLHESIDAFGAYPIDDRPTETPLNVLRLSEKLQDSKKYPCDVVPNRHRS